MSAHTKTDMTSDNELLTLVEKIKGFRYDDATTAENFALARALKLVAEDIVRRHEEVRQMQERLREKLEVANIAAELSEVVSALNAPEPAQRKSLWR
jgi:cysteine sulfinate desulfinase/cysteine desulfurase-like protein